MLFQFFFLASYLKGSLFVFCFPFDDYCSLTIVYLSIGILCLSSAGGKKIFPFMMFQREFIWVEVLKEFVGFSTFLSLKTHLQIP